MGTAHPCFELGDGRVERGVEVLGTRFRPGDDEATATGDLYPLAVLELPTVALVEKFHLQCDDLVVVPFQSGDLVGDVLPEMIRDLDITAGDDDLHSDFPRSRRRVGVADGAGERLIPGTRSVGVSS